MKYIICFFSLCIIFSGCKSTNDLIKKTNHLSYYANEILVESNLGDKNFKNNFYFSILKVDKLNQTIAFNGIPYFEDDKFDFNKINLDSLFLNTKIEYVNFKGHKMVTSKWKVKHKRSAFNFATPGYTKYGGIKYSTKNYKYVYDSLKGFVKNKEYSN